MSHDIYKRLMVSELDRDYDNILLYSAIRNEVNTDEYFTYLINKAKRIYYPRVSGNTTCWILLGFRRKIWFAG